MMNSLKWKLAALLVGVVAFAGLSQLRAAVEPTTDSGQARKLMDDGNFKDALVKFRELTLDDTDRDSKEVAEDFRRAVQCFQQLNAVHDVDEYREAVAAAHEEDWIVLAAVAQSYTEVQHQGFMIAG